ncbi:MAG: DUF5916 domain-containing protein, partial [Gemmatimonadetes bacterium]|nr:DUF5916 domain-containing protein [Gemmatimonadota bacterium]
WALAAQSVPSVIGLEAGLGAPEPTGVLDLQRLSGPIDVDGSIDEAAWAGIDPLPLTMYEPSFRGSSDRRIDLRLAYDDEGIYLAARFHHDYPKDIRAYSLTRDRWSGDDGFGLLLDTFNDDENAMRFVGLPLGAQMDMSITGDGQRENGGAGGPSGSSWNTFWDLKTRITEDGWEGEMRVPFSSLRFTEGEDGAVVMGLMAYAYEPATGSRWTFPAIPRSRPYTQVSAWQDVRLRDVAPRNPVYLSSYVLGGSTLSTALPEGASAYVAATERKYEVGGDLKITPTSNLTLDLTVNTDFAAVEADQQQVNLTRFSLFFDEKRPFFQERAGIFSFETGADRGVLFYSRRIGLSDGQPLRILGGARLVGRVGGWDVGLIEMQTQGTADQASENFGVLRARRAVLNQNSYVGGMATSRLDADGIYNVTYGLDGQFRVSGDEYVTLKWLQTIQGGDPDSDAALGGFAAGRVVADWRRRRVEGFSYLQSFVWSGEAYDPGVGYESRQNFSRAQSDWSYQWFPGEESIFRRVWVGVQGNAWWRNADRHVDTGQFEPFLTLESKPGMTLRVSTNTTYEDVPEPFSLGDDAGVPAGSYWANEAEARFRAPRGWRIQPNVTVTGGDFFDGTRVGLRTELNWAVNRYFELKTGWDWNRIRFDERGQEFDSNLMRVTAHGALDIHLSLDAFVQYNSLTQQATTNARLRYNFREGQDLWLVWNEGLNLDRDVLGAPRLPRTNARTLTMKYTHTLVL